MQFIQRKILEQGDSPANRIVTGLCTLLDRDLLAKCKVLRSLIAETRLPQAEVSVILVTLHSGLQLHGYVQTHALADDEELSCRAGHTGGSSLELLADGNVLDMQANLITMAHYQVRARVYHNGDYLIYSMGCLSGWS